MDCFGAFAPRNDGKHSFAISPQVCARFDPEFPALSQVRAQGKPGAHRTRGPRATKKHAAEPQVQADHPAFPAQWFYGLYVISPGTGLFCPRHFRRNCALRKLSASVGAPGPHDFAVRFRRARLASPSASTATRLTSVTIAKRPSWRGGMAMDLQLIWGRTKQEYFCGKDWTENSQNDPSGKSIVVLLFYCSESSSSSRVAAACALAGELPGQQDLFASSVGVDVGSHGKSASRSITQRQCRNNVHARYDLFTTDPEVLP